MGKTITKFDTDNLKDLRKAIDSAITEALSKFGLSGELGKIRYQDTEFAATLTVSTASNGQNLFIQFAKIYKLKPEWFGQQIKDSKGTVYTISGLDLKRKKFPVVATSPEGTPVGFTADGVRAQLGDKQEVMQDREREARNDYEYAAMFDKSTLNLAWLGQQVVVGKERLKIVGQNKRGRTSYIVFNDDKTLREADFLSVLNLPNNKQLRDLPKLSYKDYLAAQKAAAPATNAAA
jgi:hypothetical protein